MENATKALLISVGVLIGIILLSALVLGYNQISSYYQEQSDTIDIKQMVELNMKFTNYESRTVRGNEMLSVINLVVDYNNWIDENPNQGYQKIKLNISFEGANGYNGFHITEDNSIDYLIPKYLQNNSIVNSKLDIFSSRISNLLKDLSNNGLVTNDSVKNEKTLQLLSSNVHNINDWLKKETNPTANYYNTEYDYLKMANLLDSILKTEIIQSSQNDKDKVKKSLKSKISYIKDLRIISAKYYEITQFKRAYFTCENVGLNSSGKVTDMNFKIVLASDGSIKFN